MSTSSRSFPVSLLSLALWIALWTASGAPAHAGPGFWTPLGPGAGYGGIGCLTVHPGTPGAAWTCLPHGGLYRSADRGATWRWTGQPFANPWRGASAVSADPSRPNALWAATSSAVYRTENGGLLWVQRTGDSYTAALGETDPFQVLSVPGSLYVAAYKRLLVSRDNGSTWDALYEAEENGWIQTFSVDPARPMDLYIAGYLANGTFFYRSLDGGATWTDLTDHLFPGIERLVATSTAVYASVGDSIEGLFRSDDQGFNWTFLLETLGAPFRSVAWAVDPRAQRTLYVAGTADATSSALYLWKSRDAGRIWTKVGKLSSVPPRFLAVDSAAGTIYLASLGDLSRSLDGGATWKSVLRVPDRESSCAQISFLPEDPARLDLTVGWTAWRSLNKGRTWTLTGAPLITDIDIDPDDSARMVAVDGSNAYLSRNGGRTWRQTTGALWYIESLTRVDRQTLIAAGAGLYRSGDNGETWQTVLPGWTKWSDAGRWAQKLVVDPGDPAKIYALTFLVEDMELPHEPLAGYPSILWKSRDGGRTWHKVTQNLRALGFVFDGDFHLYGVRQRNILLSDDEGRTWTVLARTPHEVQDLVIDPTDPDIFYIAGLGVWRSTDRGAAWEQVGDPLAVSEVYSLALHPADPWTLYAAGRWGVLEMTFPEGPR